MHALFATLEQVEAKQSAQRALILNIPVLPIIGILSMGVSNDNNESFPSSLAIDGNDPSLGSNTKIQQ